MTLFAIFRLVARIASPPPVHGIAGITSLTIWWTAMFLEPLIVFRATKKKLAWKYNYFFTYLVAVWLSDVLLYPVYRIAPGSYLKWNWPISFLDDILAFGIILEILRHAIPRNRNADNIVRVTRIGRQVVSATMLCMVIICGLVAFNVRRPDLTNIVLKRDIIAIQAIFLLFALGVIFYHAIPIGRNLTGMILGYGLCLGASLVILTLRIYFGPGFNPVWEIAQPLSFWLSLMIWLVTLWNDYPDPLAEQAASQEEGSDTLASKTRMWMRAILSFPAQAARP